jgi:midasin
MEELDSTDLSTIASTLHPEASTETLASMISFNSDVHLQTTTMHKFGAEGAPWEFNLRDVLRWLEIMRVPSALDLCQGDPLEYAGLLYIQRFRSARDRCVHKSALSFFFSRY